MSKENYKGRGLTGLGREPARVPNVSGKWWGLGEVPSGCDIRRLFLENSSLRHSRRCVGIWNRRNDTESTLGRLQNRAGREQDRETHLWGLAGSWTSASQCGAESQSIYRRSAGAPRTRNFQWGYRIDHSRFAPRILQRPSRWDQPLWSAFVQRPPAIVALTRCPCQT